MNLTIEDAIQEMMEKLAKRIPAEHKKQPVNLYIVGGIAIYFHTASRVSKDVDAIIDRSIDIPRKLSVLWLNENGEFEELEFDKNYTDTLGIMHEDYDKRAIYKFTIASKLKVHILSPVDLIISKLARFVEQDQQDIKSIIKNDLVNKNELEKLARDAIEVSGSGRKETLELHLDLALEMFD